MYLVSHIFTVVMFSRSKMDRKPACLVEIEFRETIAPKCLLLDLHCSL